MNNQETRRSFTAKVNRPALKMAIKFHRFSYEQLADRAGLSKGTIGNLMTKRQTCTTESASKIAQALGVTTEDIFFLIPLIVEPTKHAA